MKITRRLRKNLTDTIVGELDLAFNSILDVLQNKPSGFKQFINVLRVSDYENLHALLEENVEPQKFRQVEPWVNTLSGYMMVYDDWADVFSGFEKHLRIHARRNYGLE